jgi:hypothetical protein
MEEEMKNAEQKRRKQGFYKPGEGFNLCLPVVDPLSKLCRVGCGATDHKTKQSKKCPFNANRQHEKAKQNKLAADKEIKMLRKRLEELENNK